MNISSEGIELLVKSEGMRLEAYKCQAGVWTIGVGHTGRVDGKGVCEGMKISKEKAFELLAGDVKVFEDYLNCQPFAGSLSQNMFDALVNFVFNIGLNAFQTSTMRRKLLKNVADETIPQEFDKWVYVTVNGEKRVSTGLKERRRREKKLFKKSF